MIACAADTIASLPQVVADETLEVIELPVRYQHRRVNPVADMPDVQQLDSRPFPCQTLDGQLDIRKALELDLQSQPLIHARCHLGVPHSVRLYPHRFNLTLQRSPVAGAIALGYKPTAPSALR